MWVAFRRRPDGAHVVEVHQPDLAQPQRAVRTGDVPPPFAVAADLLRSYSGTYATESVEVKVAVDERGELTMEAPGQPPMKLRPVSQTKFQIDGTPMRVVFHPDNGKDDRFTLHRGARELHGRRVGG